MCTQRVAKNIFSMNDKTFKPFEILQKLCHAQATNHVGSGFHPDSETQADITGSPKQRH